MLGTQTNLITVERENWQIPSLSGSKLCCKEGKWYGTFEQIIVAGRKVGNIGGPGNKHVFPGLAEWN